MEFEWDDWQKSVLETKGNICIVAGRQVGKSTIISYLACAYAVSNQNKQILIISATERQAYLLFSKVLFFLDDNFKSMLKKGKDKPTKTEIKLRNGSVIRCLPTGTDGLGVRGFTTHMLIADEAHFINEPVWDAVVPQLTTTEAIQILISTAHGSTGYFYRCFNDDNFTKFKITTEEVALKRPDPYKTRMLEHLEREKRRMSSREYAQEYLAAFLSDLSQYFDDNLIATRMTRQRGEKSRGDYFLGVDISRLGDDQTAYEIVQKINRDKIIHIDSIVTEKVRLNETYNEIINLDKIYNFKEIYIDDGGIGGGVFDYLLETEQTKRKVIAINNRSRPLDRSEKHKKKILKEDLYSNLLMLLEQDKLELLKDDEIFLSFKGIQYEYDLTPNAKTRLKIFGKKGRGGDHIVEGLTRACWCMRNKTLNIWCR